MPSPKLVAWVAAALSVLGGPALAHTGAATGGAFAAGLMHPLNGLDHLLAMVAVGLWGAVLGRPLVHALPVVFPQMMVVGGILGILAVPLLSIELGIALSVLLLGILIAGEIRLPVALACVVVGVFAIFHGYAHGQELPEAANPLAYTAGFVLTTGTLHLAGIALGTVRKLPGGRVAAQVMGGATAFAGVFFLANVVGG